MPKKKTKLSSLTKEQKQVLRISQKLHEKYKDDFEGWVKENISFAGLKCKGITDQQREIAENIAKHKNVCVSAGGGIGKTALAALTTLWFLSTFPYSKIPTTAPSAKQLYDVLWSEIALWLNRCKLKSLFHLVKGKLSMRGFPEWFAAARTVPKDGKNLNDTLAGFHAASGYMLILVDESSGVPDPVFTALEGAMTDENSYILLISNPVSFGGYYYDTISDPDGKGKDYKVLYYSSIDSPLVDDSYAQRIINRYGKNSAMYRSKVLGKPISASENVVCAPDAYEQILKENTIHFAGPVVMSIDIGGGGDKTVFCHREAMSVIRWDEIHTITPDDIVDSAIRMYERLYQGRPFTCVVDAGGIGWGPYHMLRKKAHFPVVAFIGAEKAREPTMYANRRTEGYHYLKQEMPNLHFTTPPPGRLKKELANLFFNLADEPITMEPKKKFHSRLGFSPDYADALMMGIDVTNMVALGSYKITKPVNKAMQRLHIHKRSDKFGAYKQFIV